MLNGRHPIASAARTARVILAVTTVGLLLSHCSDTSDTQPDTTTEVGVTASVEPGAPPTVAPPMTVTEPAPTMLLDSDVGPSADAVLQPMASAAVVPGGSYENVTVNGSLDIPGGVATTVFSECRIEGTIITYSPIELHSCVVTGGIYAYETGGVISDSLLLGDGQAFRPGTLDIGDAFSAVTPWTVVDTVIRVEAGVSPQHVEASQVLGGVGLTFRNVVFEVGGPFNNTQTADFNFIGKGLRCYDCWFVGFGGYSLYSAGTDNVFVRPHFGRNAEFGLVYPGEDPLQAPIIIDPVYIDGAPASVT
jgi:hypothetical protein